MKHRKTRRKLTFFFSSRRRHTRLQGDWSSDVCSSDLVWLGRTPRHLAQRHGVRWPEGGRGGRASMGGRSEERRVGKERRARRKHDNENNKGADGGTEREIGKNRYRQRRTNTHPQSRRE